MVLRGTDAALAELASVHAGKQMVVVSHGTLIRLVLTAMHGVDHPREEYGEVVESGPGLMTRRARIFIILDNLSAHTVQRIRRWAQSHSVELCFTPTYAPWANPTGAHFGLLRQSTLASSNQPNHTVQTRRPRSYLRGLNAHARNPEVLDAQRRERARIRSDKRHRRRRHDKPKAA